MKIDCCAGTEGTDGRGGGVDRVLNLVQDEWGASLLQEVRTCELIPECAVLVGTA